MKKENPGKCIFKTHLLYLLKVPGGGAVFKMGTYSSFFIFMLILGLTMHVQRSLEWRFNH